MANWNSVYSGRTWTVYYSSYCWFIEGVWQLIKVESVSGTWLRLFTSLALSPKWTDCIRQISVRVRRVCSHCSSRAASGRLSPLCTGAKHSQTGSREAPVQHNTRFPPSLDDFWIGFPCFQTTTTKKFNQNHHQKKENYRKHTSISHEFWNQKQTCVGLCSEIKHACSPCFPKLHFSVSKTSPQSRWE